MYSPEDINQDFLNMYLHYRDVERKENFDKVIKAYSGRSVSNVLFDCALHAYYGSKPDLHEGETVLERSMRIKAERERFYKSTLDRDFLMDLAVKDIDPEEVEPIEGSNLTKATLGFFVKKINELRLWTSTPNVNAFVTSKRRIVMVDENAKPLLKTMADITVAGETSICNYLFKTTDNNTYIEKQMFIQTLAGMIQFPGKNIFTGIFLLKDDCIIQSSYWLSNSLWIGNPGEYRELVKNFVYEHHNQYPTDLSNIEEFTKIATKGNKCRNCIYSSKC